MVILEHPQISLTHGLIDALLHNNTVLVTCDKRYMPAGILVPFEGNSLLSDRYKAQIEASLPLKKQLWQQTIKAKIINQAAVLEYFKGDAQPLRIMAAEVLSGDSGNVEGAAAKYYWSQLFNGAIEGFRRNRDGEEPNNALNFTYAILRSTVCRSLVGSGLLPALGIHHRNKYNAFALADDMMEPFRPVADFLVVKLLIAGTDFAALTQPIKAQLLSIITTEVRIKSERSPLMLATQRTAASLVAALEGKSRKLLLPEVILP